MGGEHAETAPHTAAHPAGRDGDDGFRARPASGCARRRSGDAAHRRDRRQPVQGAGRKGEAGARFHDPVHLAGIGRRGQARGDASEFVRPLGLRILDAQENRPVRQSAGHRCQENQILRPDRADLHARQVAGRQAGRNGGHLANQGRLSHREQVEGIHQGSIAMDDGHSHRLQRRHARNPTRPGR